MASEKIDALELDITSSLNTDNIDKLIDKLGELGKALDNLKSKKVSVSLTDTGKAATNAAGGMGKLLSKTIKFAAVIAIFRKLGTVIADGISKAATYTKTLNMFTASMGEYTDNALKYANTVRDAVGIDPTSWLKAQGVFQTLITGFGVTGDKAAYMSQNITQLSYDIAAFYGITNEEAQNKLKSALSGRLEPIRKLGYDLSQAKLVDIAKNPANYGKQTFKINEQTGAVEANTRAVDDNTKHKIVNFNQLTQAEKVQLRYIALMTQVTQVQGMYAAALNDPAKQMNFFKEQLNQAGRALGNIFIPVLNKVLPILSAFAQLAAQAFQSIANLFGFKIPDMKERTDISKNQKPYNDVVKATGKAANNAKKMKDYMLGIDELNVFNPNTNAGAGAGSGGGQNSNLKNLKLPGYNFLSKAVENSINKAKKAIQQFFDDLKKKKFNLKDLFVWGAGELGSNFWEAVIGMSPEELAEKAEKLGRTTGEQFIIELSTAIKNGVGDFQTNFWTWVFGQSPKELQEAAAKEGRSVGEQFKVQLVHNANPAAWEIVDSVKRALFGEQAAKAGNTVSQQFWGSFALNMLKSIKQNPALTWFYNLTAGKSSGMSIDEMITKLEKKLSAKDYEQGNKSNDYTVKGNTSAEEAQRRGKQLAASYADGMKSGEKKVKDEAKNLYYGASKGVSDGGRGTEMFYNTSAKQAEQYGKGLSSKLSEAHTNGEQLYKSGLQGASAEGNAYKEYEKAANSGISGYASSFSNPSNTNRIFAGGAKLGDKAIEGAESKVKGFQKTGSNSSLGYIKGIGENIKSAANKGAELGAAALKALKKELKEGSPSKRFAESGMYSAMGYANGITEYTSTATRAVSNMANAALRAANTDPMAMRSSVSMSSSTGISYGIGAANEGAMAGLASSIYQAVAGGVSAMSSYAGQGDIKVIIDGKEVFKAVQTEQRKRGAVVSNGAFSR